MSRIQWLGCDLRTGRIVEELPALRPSGSISRRLGSHTSTRFALPLAGAPGDWEAATEPGRTMVVALADDVPVWAGLVLTRRGGSSGSVEIGCVTPEAYLDRRYTGDHTWVQQDESSVIAAGLFGDTQLDGLNLTIDAEPTGKLRDRTYEDADDSTVLTRLRDLMDVEDGPEWTVDVQWRSGTSEIELVARVRKRIGVQTSRPNAVFTYPWDVDTYEFSESYEADNGATVVRARGEGEGTSRYTSDDAVATDLIAAGWPRYEYRYTPSTSITDNDVLNAHANGALNLMRTGARVWSLDVVAQQAPRLGRDWGLGDTIRLHVISSPRHPAGVEMVARVWGWDWDTDKGIITPILAED